MSVVDPNPGIILDLKSPLSEEEKSHLMECIKKEMSGEIGPLVQAPFKYSMDEIEALMAIYYDTFEIGFFHDTACSVYCETGNNEGEDRFYISKTPEGKYQVSFLTTVEHFEDDVDDLPGAVRRLAQLSNDVVHWKDNKTQKQAQLEIIQVHDAHVDSTNYLEWQKLRNTYETPEDFEQALRRKFEEEAERREQNIFMDAPSRRW